MTRIAVRRRIDAPAPTVFRAISEIERFPEIQPEVVSIEFLTESRSGVGTRFRETRSSRGREMVTELEVTEWVEGERVRMVTDSHGSVWDTLFEIRPADGRVELEITMDARPHKLLPRLMVPLMQGVFRKGMEQYVDLLRDHCEAARAGGEQPAG